MRVGPKLMDLIHERNFPARCVRPIVSHTSRHSMKRTWTSICSYEEGRRRRRRGRALSSCHSLLSAQKMASAPPPQTARRIMEVGARKPAWRCLSCLACAADVWLACDAADVHRLCLREGRTTEPDGHVALGRVVVLPHQHRRGITVRNRAGLVLQ